LGCWAGRYKQGGFLSIATTKKVLRDFLSSDRNDVLALHGAWGVGKTHVWREALVANKVAIKRPNYCYVSLFGIRNLAELRTSIFLKSQPVKSLGIDPKDESVAKKWKRIFSASSMKWLYERFGSVVNVLPFAKNLTASVETIAPHFVRNMLICLDDFERSPLKPDEVLGLVSELKEEKACKVALVFNFDKLGDRESYRSYKEKVIDLEILYAPTVDEAVLHAIPTDLPERAQIIEYIRELQITNIRILRKIFDAVTLVLDATCGMHAEVRREAVASTVLFCWCAYGTDASKPDVADIAHWNRRLLVPRLKKGEVLPEPEAEQAALLCRYGFGHVEDFHLAIARVVDRGFLEETGFVEEARKRDASLHGLDKSEAFRQVWRRFHGTFTDDRDSFIEQMHATAKDSAEHIGSGDLNSTVSILRQLSRDDLADDLIAHYIDAHKDKPRTFDLAEHPFGGSIDDPSLREQFEKAYAMLAKTPSLSEAIHFMVKGGSWNAEHVAALRRASVDDFQALFLGPHDYDVHSNLVKRCISWGGDLEDAGVRKNAREALERIKASSDLNALRVKQFGV